MQPCLRNPKPEIKEDEDHSLRKPRFEVRSGDIVIIRAVFVPVANVYVHMGYDCSRLGGPETPTNRTKA